MGLFTVNTVRDVLQLRQACEIPAEWRVFSLLGGRNVPAISPRHCPPRPPTHARHSRSHCCAAQNKRIAGGGAALWNIEAGRTFRRRDKVQSTPRWEDGTAAAAGGGRCRGLNHTHAAGR